MGHRIKAQALCTRCENLWFCVVNRARTTWRAPMGFALFISFPQYFEFHCIDSRRGDVAVPLA